jgi:GDPmannose 4,6-dehydratase
VPEIVEIASKIAGLDWRQYVRGDKQLLRLTDPRCLIGNADKAARLLRWQPEMTFEKIITEMTQAEIAAFSVANWKLCNLFNFLSTPDQQAKLKF